MAFANDVLCDCVSTHSDYQPMELKECGCNSLTSFQSLNLYVYYMNLKSVIEQHT